MLARQGVALRGFCESGRRCDANDEGGVIWVFAIVEIYPARF